MQLGISITHHDHDYVERRGGHIFLTHLRGARARALYREQAVNRAYESFTAGHENSCPEAELGGRGLLVLQRALFAAEDVGGLLYALKGAASDIWPRLVTTRIPDIDAVFIEVLQGAPEAMAPFCLPMPPDSTPRS